MIKGFRDFVTGGNLIEVAVGLVMALATLRSCRHWSRT